MRARELSLIAAVACAVLLTAPAPALAYIGPGPGLEFIPYFMSLLMWAGLALGGVLLWPFTSLVRRIRGQRGQAPVSADPPPAPADSK
ncbi:MAG: hypothetical protein L0Y71_11030 [Gemmataceae bacterium]|nr:hypothetical protein [Gemmataceae bacterium]